MVAQMIKSNGGYIMALKNYDGDVQSDIVAFVLSLSLSPFPDLLKLTSLTLIPIGKVSVHSD